VRLIDRTVQSPVEAFSYIVFREGDIVKAKNGITGHIDFMGTDASTVIQQAINALSGGGVVFVKDINPATFTIASVPNHVLVIVSYRGSISLVKPGVGLILNNFGSRSFEEFTLGNTLRLRDNTNPANMIDLYSIDPVTGDIHFFVNTSVDNMNLAGFLGRNNLPPAYRWLNKNSSPVKVFDMTFRDDGILSIRTGDPTIDSQPVIDRLGVSQDGRLYRVNMPPPGYVSPIPNPPYRPDIIGATILYFVVDLSPTTSQDASAIFDISPDNTTWFSSIVKVGVGAGGSNTTQTVTIYVPSGWWVRWTLQNASIVTLFKQYI